MIKAYTLGRLLPGTLVKWDDMKVPAIAAFWLLWIAPPALARPLAAPPHHSAGPTADEETPGNILLRLGSLARKENRATERDEFATAPTHADYIGKPFFIDVPASDNGSALLSYYYDGVLHLNVEKSYPQLSLGTDTSRYDAFIVTSKDVYRGSHTGQNVFGARARVSDTLTSDIGVLVISMPRGDNQHEYGRDDAIADDYKFEEQIDGPAAKAAVTGAHLRLEGVIARLPNGKVTACGVSSSPATMDLPVSLTSEQCFVAVELSRVAIIEGTGRVVKDWELPAR